MSEGSQEGAYVTPYVDPSEHTINIGGTDYHSENYRNRQSINFHRVG